VVLLRGAFLFSCGSEQLDRITRPARAAFVLPALPEQTGILSWRSRAALKGLPFRCGIA